MTPLTHLKPDLRLALTSIALVDLKTVKSLTSVIKKAEFSSPDQRQNADVSV